MYVDFNIMIGIKYIFFNTFIHIQVNSVNYGYKD